MARTRRTTRNSQKAAAAAEAQQVEDKVADVDAADETPAKKDTAKDNDNVASPSAATKAADEPTKKATVVIAKRRRSSAGFAVGSLVGALVFTGALLSVPAMALTSSFIASALMASMLTGFVFGLIAQAIADSPSAGPRGRTTVVAGGPTVVHHRRGPVIAPRPHPTVVRHHIGARGPMGGPSHVRVTRVRRFDDVPATFTPLRTGRSAAAHSSATRVTTTTTPSVKHTSVRHGHPASASSSFGFGSSSHSSAGTYTAHRPTTHVRMRRV